MNDIKVTWKGHSCFKIEYDHYSLIIDPYKDHTVPGLNPLKESANLILCSHEHGDHCGRELINYVQKDSIPFKIETIETYHDDKQGTLRGNNTIHIITVNHKRIAHLGDLGCSLTDKQIEQLKDLDLLLIPIGGYYTIDALQAISIIQTLNPKTTIPMHYRNGTIGYDVIDTLDTFKENIKTIELNTNTIFLSNDLPKILILSL